MVRDAEVRMRKADLFVAVDRTGQLIGSVTYVRAGTRYAIAAHPDEAELRMLAVTHHRRRRITERHLIAACIARAGEDGCAGLLCFELRGKRLGWEFERVGFAQDRDRTLHPAPGIDLLTFRRRI
jgi:N-acetylglutamate synthase-like GNAT family acetyltransferase